MRKYRIFAGLALLIVGMVLTLNVTVGSDRIDRLYIFGDSLSDAGNVYRKTGGTSPPSPPYFQGRYSNGPVWVEHLAAKLGLKADRVTNFAWGGAMTGEGNEVPSLLAQVRAFSQQKPRSNPRALAIVWIGGNDYLRGTLTPSVPLNNLSQAFTSLSRLGIRNFLIVNLPDFGQFPITRGKEEFRSLSALIKAHNRGLSAMIAKFNHQPRSGVKWLEFDGYAFFQEAIAHPERFRFENVKDACLRKKVICPKPDRFLFWDSIHPTATTHRLIGESAYRAIEKAL